VSPSYPSPCSGSSRQPAGHNPLRGRWASRGLGSAPHLPHAAAANVSELYETPSQRPFPWRSPVGSTPLSRTVRCPWLARGNTLRNGTEGPLLERMLSGGVSLWQGQTGSFDLCLSGSWGRAAVGHKPSFDKGFLAGGCAVGSPQSPPRTLRNGLPGDDARHFLASLGWCSPETCPMSVWFVTG
jgi:hypothetical protein